MSDLEQIKKNGDIFEKVLEKEGYVFERNRMVKGVRSLVYKLPEQKTGCLYLWEQNDGIYLYKDYGPYVGGGGSVIDFVINAQRLPNNTSGQSQAIQIIREIASLSNTPFKSAYNPATSVASRLKEVGSKGYQANNNFKVEILNKRLYFSMDNIRQHSQTVFSYLQQRGIKEIKKLETYYTNISYGGKEWNKVYIGIPYGFSTFFIKKENYKKIYDGIELRDTYINSRMKTLSYVKEGAKIGKTPSFFLSKNRKNLLIFESVIDYLSLQYKINSYDSDIAIMNGTGLADFLAKEMLSQVYKIDKQNFKKYDNITIFEQNDLPGKIASTKIIPFLADKYDSNFFITSYEEGEEGYDINDLIVKKGCSAEEILNNRVSQFDAIQYKDIVEQGVAAKRSDKEIVDEIEEHTLYKNSNRMSFKR